MSDKTCGTCRNLPHLRKGVTIWTGRRMVCPVTGLYVCISTSACARHAQQVTFGQAFARELKK